MKLKNNKYIDYYFNVFQDWVMIYTGTWNINMLVPIDCFLLLFLILSCYDIHVSVYVYDTK